MKQGVVAGDTCWEMKDQVRKLLRSSLSTHIIDPVNSLLI